MGRQEGSVLCSAHPRPPAPYRGVLALAHANAQLRSRTLTGDTTLRATVLQCFGLKDVPCTPHSSPVSRRAAMSSPYPQTLILSCAEGIRALATADRCLRIATSDIASGILRIDDFTQRTDMPLWAELANVRSLLHSTLCISNARSCACRTTTMSSSSVNTLRPSLLRVSKVRIRSIYISAVLTSEFLYSSVYLSLHVHACCADTDAMITELDSLNVVRAGYFGRYH